jgi:hypothetical protein
MHKAWLSFAVLQGAVLVAACDSDGTVGLVSDGGGADVHIVTFDGPTPFDAGTPVEASRDADAGGAPPPSRLLLSYNGSARSELVAFGLQSEAVDGRLIYDDPLGTAYAGTTAPWLLE